MSSCNHLWWDHSPLLPLNRGESLDFPFFIWSTKTTLIISNKLSYLCISKASCLFLVILPCKNISRNLFVNKEWHIFASDKNAYLRKTFLSYDYRKRFYLNKLIARRDNGRIKVITGIRRCGKSVLLFDIYKDYLLKSGVKEDFALNNIDELEETLLCQKLLLFFRHQLRRSIYCRHRSFGWSSGDDGISKCSVLV